MRARQKAVPMKKISPPEMKVIQIDSPPDYFQVRR
jgi:hypothetical protein